MTAKRQLEPSETALHAAQRYLESLLDTDAPLTPGELESVQDSVEQIRQGKMTLEEFERKHGL
ncbi:MAG TPA: hypothetical protein VFA33_20300 [Bryobacteraceae bacterium]|nr:hypothetical protein [Bryobacteraceae bacterium]